MPWEGARGPEYTADVRRFFELTRGHVILLGPRTYRSVPAFAHEDRTVVAIRSSEQPANVIARYPDRVIYIGGGPPVWTAYDCCGHRRSRRLRAAIPSSMPGMLAALTYLRGSARWRRSTPCAETSITAPGARTYL